MGFVERGLNLLGLALVLAVAIGLAAIVILFIVDSLQTRDAIRRNYPVLGRFRYLFTNLGEFFRQYFFAMDREEMPFNRAQRGWVEHAAKGDSNTIAFGSTRNIDIVGTPIFVNSAFPPLDEEAAPAAPLMIGPEAKIPFVARSFFNISGMSYGAISAPAVMALARGAKQAGVWMNTGEGGVSDYHLQAGCDLVYQIGTAKYGVRTPEGRLDDDKLRAVAAYEQVRMFEIKLSQGAKPGKGGILPGEKVTPEIARVRGIAVGQTSHSPNRHEEVHNWSELLDFIGHVREVSGKPVGVKMCIGSVDGLREMFETINARGADSAPDFITIDGGEGGTGASPMPLMDLVGMPIRDALPRTVDMLHEYGLRNRIRVIASAKLVNPGDVAWALASGADFVASARGFMFALGCIQALKCNRNTCPTGITTHDPRLQQGLVVEDKFQRVANYATSVIKDVETIAHSVGVDDPRKLTRAHVRVVQPNGRSIRMNALFPEPEARVH
ncbi:FMN-binding glutamate synthase family protein [Meridianimarinicoccus roseus]|jgi:glutamate synthase domain-containing protein 2|uniref:FMN-binding glutamate synthase family protein n=1 Tax=Meridianimarinicoccus roseus TaxID=2072018 RepID=A0A2V2LDD8_9RHOB|nr:FMN-binding glutamate synthase family protein [Meridianimarinicoccus roseus]PWR01791.1 FMN-binding glutamate synthase family protein [Meridianimarinicoccus roseus]